MYLGILGLHVTPHKIPDIKRSFISNDVTCVPQRKKTLVLFVAKETIYLTKI